MLLKELFSHEDENTPKYDLIDDISFFIDNDDELHKEYFLPVVKELKRKKVVERDSIDEIAPAFKLLVKKGCEKYNEKYTHKDNMYTEELLKEIAKKLAEKHLPFIK